MSINIGFYLHNTKFTGRTPIQARIIYNGRRWKYGIGFSIYPELWNSDRQAPTSRKKLIQKFRSSNPNIDIDLERIKIRIKELETEVKSEILKLEAQSIDIDFKKLKEKFDQKYKSTKKETKNSEQSLNKYARQYVIELESGIRVYTNSQGVKRKYAPGTVKTYKEWLTQWFTFQENSRRKFNFKDITADTYNLYISYFEMKGCATNTIGKNVKILKAIMRASLAEGLHKNTEFTRKFFKTAQVDTDQVYLTKVELRKLFELDLSDHHELDLCRDVFLCGCYTALRFSDYSKIEKKNVKQLSYGKVLEMISKKTGTKVVIPIRPELESILFKYDFTLPHTYEQKMNRLIKKISEIAGINSLQISEKIVGGLKSISQIPKYELVTTHTARRTACTLMYLDKIPTIDIMKISGHKKESSFLKYIRVTGQETAERLSRNSFFMGNNLNIAK